MKPRHDISHCQGLFVRGEGWSVYRCWNVCGVWRPAWWISCQILKQVTDMSSYTWLMDCEYRGSIFSIPISMVKMLQLIKSLLDLIQNWQYLLLLGKYFFLEKIDKKSRQGCVKSVHVLLGGFKVLLPSATILWDPCRCFRHLREASELKSVTKSGKSPQFFWPPLRQDVLDFFEFGKKSKFDDPPSNLIWEKF